MLPVSDTGKVKSAPDISKSVRRGRNYVAAVIAFHAVLAVGVVILAVVMQRDGQILRQLLKLAGSIGLMYSLWLGSAWVRWLYVFGLTITCLGAAVIPALAPETLAPAVGYPLAAVAAFGTWVLAFSSSGNDFFRWRKGEIDLQTAESPHLENRS